MLHHHPSILTQLVTYIDPGTGGLLLQILLGGAAGIAFVCKIYWHKLAGFFKRKDKKNEPTA